MSAQNVSLISRGRTALAVVVVAMSVMSLLLATAASSNAEDLVFGTLFVAADGSGTNSGLDCANAKYSLIQEAIDAAASLATVHVCSGTWDVAAAGTLTVQRSVTIEGEGGLTTVLEGGGAVRLLTIQPDSGPIAVAVKDLVFAHGRHLKVGALDGGGGGILVDLSKASLTVERSTFLHNTTDDQGGAIHGLQLDGKGGAGSEGGALRVLESTFVNNDATVDGGAIAATYANTLLADDPFGADNHLVLNSTFFGNHAHRNGGAIARAFAGGMAIKFSTFVDNTSDSRTFRDATPTHGQAIYLGGADKLSNSIVASSTDSATPQCYLPSSEAADSIATSACRGAAVETYDALRLSPLGDFGGPLQTIQVGAGSTALDLAGSDCPDDDQRGTSRSGAPDACTVGAYEYHVGQAEVAPASRTIHAHAGEAIGDDSSPYSPADSFSQFLLSASLSSGDQVPGWLSIEETTGRLIGVPASAGTATYMVTARKDKARASAVVTLIVVSAQTITVTTHAPASAKPGDSFNVAATASSGLPVTISGSGNCSGTGTGTAMITMSTVGGDCSVAYSQAGNGTYAAAESVTEMTKLPSRDRKPPVSTASTAATPAPAVQAAAPASSDRGVGAHTGDTDNSGLLLTLGLWGLVASGSLVLKDLRPDQWRSLAIGVPLLIGFLLVRALVAAWDFKVTWLPTRARG